MVITLLSGEYPPQPGGVGDYTRRLGEALVARGHTVDVFTIYDLRFTIYALGEQNRKSQIVNREAKWDWRIWTAVDAALAMVRPDVLHIQYQTGAYGMHPAINLLPWHLRRRATRTRIAVTMHDLLLPYLFPKAEPLRHWVTRHLVRDADAVIVTNNDDLDQLIQRYLPTPNTQHPTPNTQHPHIIPIGSNIRVAPPSGYQRAAWRTQLGVREGDTLVAYFGLISRSKGLDLLLRALARLPERVRLLVVGGAATAPQDIAFAAEVEQLIDALGLRERVQRTGHIAEAEVSAHLLATDIAALPFADGASLRRGSLLAVLAHGVPVVTTLSGQRSAVSGQVVGKEHALLVSPNDDAAVAAAIARLADDAALRARLGASGRTFARQFGWEAIAEAHERMYGQLVPVLEE